MPVQKVVKTQQGQMKTPPESGVSPAPSSSNQLELDDTGATFLAIDDSGTNFLIIDDS